MRKWFVSMWVAAGIAVCGQTGESGRVFGQAPVVNTSQAQASADNATSLAAFERQWVDHTLAGAAGEPSCVAESSGPPHGVPARHYGSVDYLLWWTKGSSLPPLVTSSPANTLRQEAGVIGLPGTQVLFGDEQSGQDSRSGIRASLGRWLDDCGTKGVEVGYFGVFHDGSGSEFAAATGGQPGSGLPILARPFFDVSNGDQNARILSFPGIVDGAVNVASNSELHSVNATFRRHWREGELGRIDMLAGYRYFRFRDSLRVQENFVSTAPVGNIAQGTAFSIFDDFATENDFHGAELGAAMNLHRGGPWGLDLLAKVALGNLHRSVAIAGQTTIQTPGPAGGLVVNEGGLLALSSNIGRTSENEFGVLPEFRANATYDINDCWTLQFGYTLLLLNGVARAGEQIDLNVNPNLLPGGNGQGPAVPAAASHNTSDFWAQGLNFGVTGRF